MTRCTPGTTIWLCLILLTCAGCNLKPFEQPSSDSAVKLTQLTLQDRKQLILMLHEEAAKYDRSFWMAAKGNQIREFISKIESRDETVMVIYDDQNRIVQVKSGISKVKFKPDKTP